MERLTKFARNKTCCVDFNGVECMILEGHCCKCSTNDKVWDKLRYYEELEEQLGENLCVVIEKAKMYDGLCK